MPSIRVNDKQYEYNTDPDHCPICHHGIVPTLLCSSNILGSTMNGDILQNVYLCPRSDCQKVFIGNYRQNKSYRGPYPDGPHILKSTSPYVPKSSEVPKEVADLSPDYCELLNQSETAEAYRLNQIAGVGYRKSLEFLIKDYTISKNPGKEEDITKQFLGNVINNYISDENIKECARRAAWLGNDETHYVRKWEEKDIEDLKTLIKLTQTWMHTSLLTEKYLSEMK